MGNLVRSLVSKFYAPSGDRNSYINNGIRAFCPSLWSLTGKKEQFCSTRGVKCLQLLGNKSFTDLSRSDGSFARPLLLRLNDARRCLTDLPDTVMIEELIRF
jgi:hypothetical protein